MTKFIKSHSLEQRKVESSRIRNKYPNRIPIIIEPSSDCSLPNIDRKKYLVPEDLTLGQFMYIIRKRIELGPEKAIYLFVGNIIPTTSQYVSVLYSEHKNEDGFLYITYSGENTFG